VYTQDRIWHQIQVNIESADDVDASGVAIGPSVSSTVLNNGRLVVGTEPNNLLFSEPHTVFQSKYIVHLVYSSTFLR